MARATPAPDAAALAAHPEPRPAASHRALLVRPGRRWRRAPPPPRRSPVRRSWGRAARRTARLAATCGCPWRPHHTGDRRRPIGRRAASRRRATCASWAQGPGSRGHPEMALRLAPIAETAARRAVDLIILVTLARDQHHIP